MAHPHPSVWILDFLEQRGELTLDHVAAGMCEATGDGFDREWQVNRLALDLYFAVGPTDSRCRLGEMAAKLDRAFERRPGFFAALERKWIEGGCSTEGLRS
jgi:hypothetical protein